MPRAGFVLADDGAHISHRHTLRSKVIILGYRPVRYLVPVAHVVRCRTPDNFFDARAVAVVNVLCCHAANRRLRQAVLVIVGERIASAAGHVIVRGESVGCAYPLSN